MGGTKANRHATKTDTLIRTVDQARQARGLDRHRIIPRTSQLPSGGGNNPAGGQHVGAVGSFLDASGDTMVGPIAFQPKVATITKTDPAKPSIDIGINGEDYSTYIIAGTSTPDSLHTIFNANFSGQILYLQSSAPTALILINGDSINDGNILTGTGGDLQLNFGEVAQLIFDVTASTGSATVRGAWRLMVGGRGADPATALLGRDTDQVLNATGITVIVYDDNFFFGDTNKIQATATPGVFVLLGGFNYKATALGSIQASDAGSGSSGIAQWEVSLAETGPFNRILAGILEEEGQIRGIFNTGRATFTTQSSATALLIDATFQDVFIRQVIDGVEGTLQNWLEVASGATIETIGLGGGSSGGGGGGATSLNELTDVTITSPQNNEHLVFNSTSAQWENQVTQGGGMNTDLSNMIAPTVPTVDLSLNGNSLLGVLNVDFDGLGGIRGLSSLDFFQTDQVINSLAQGLIYQVQTGAEHLFLVGGANGIKVDDVGGGVVILDMLGNRIDNTDRIEFSGGIGINNLVAGIGLNTSGATDFMEYNTPATDQNHQFSLAGNTRLIVELGGISVQGVADLSSALQLQPNASPSLIAGRFRSDGTDVLIFSGGEERNISSIGQANIISQGDSSVQVIDAGAGSVSVTVDGNLKSTQDANNLAMLTSMSMNTQNITGTADILPSLNHNNFIGGSTLFYAGGFFDRIRFQNLNNQIVGDTGGLDYFANTSGEHKFLVGGFERFNVQNGQIDMFRTLLMNSNDIQQVRDLIFQSGGLIDMNNGTISAVGRINMATNANIAFLGGDITGIDDMTFQGSGSFLDLNFGDAINIDRCEVNGQFNHKGTTFGHYGVVPVVVPVMSRAQSSDSLAVLIARFQILQDILSQRTSASSGNPSGTGIIELFGF